VNIIQTKPVGKLILNEATPERDHNFEHYLIPYYQRGYRWDIENVEALLDDIHNFIQSKEENYCLQPIVVVPNIDDEGHNIWEVIDGQQRLITMYIIFQYLNKPRYSIVFGQRTKSTDFLRNLSNSTYNHDNPDFHFMSQAYEKVMNWFKIKTKYDVGYVDDFNSKINKKVQVIWYQVEELRSFEEEAGNNEIENKKIDIFNRLNIGKIPLTDAELIRALLLSKIKFGLSERESIMRQAEVSNEWHQIELELRDEEFWFFLNNKPKDDNTSAIELIFKLIAEDNSKKYSTYLWFEKQIRSDNEELEREKAVELWNKTKDYFNKMKYWYNNDNLYHYLGFILTINENNITTLRTILENSNCKKDKFKEWAFGIIKDNMTDVKLDELSYDKKSKNLEKVFLLHNVITTDKLNTAQKNRFPFNLYKKTKLDGGWSIEHIHAQQSQEMKDDKAIRKWLEDTYTAIQNINTIEKEVKKNDEKGKEFIEIEIVIVDKLIKKEVYDLSNTEIIDTNTFNVLKEKIIKIFESDSLHELDNLALLSKKDNSSLNNSIFPVKRNKIIQMEKEGKFVPITTRNVFFKYYNESDLQPFYWSKSDKKYYVKNIEDILNPYLS
jgi:hypothetical protein